MITYPLNNIDYTAEDAELFHCTRTSGIWAKDSFSISVTGADNNATIGTGIAWINNEKFSGKVTALKTAKVLDLGIADGRYPRIDVIAIQYSANNNATDVVIKKGTPSTNPVRPAIVRSGAVYELYLASVYRPAGATAITASNITDLRMDETVCGLMADSVTKIDMTAIEAQVRTFINNLQNEIDEVKKLSGLMFETEWVEDGVISASKGGTGKTTHTSNAVLTGNGTSAVKNVATASGAFYATATNGAAKFGTLPVAQGGTGSTSASGARTNLGLDGKLFTQYTLNSINIDNTGGNWTVDISETGHGAIPMPWVNVTQTTGAHFIVQTAIKCDISQSVSGRDQRMWIRDKYSSGVWSNWKEVLTENRGVQMVKLWENASPTSSMSSQILTLSAMANYDYIEIICAFSTSYPKRLLVSALVPVAVSNQAVIYASTYYRTITIQSTTSVSIENAGGNDNTFVIPLYINGIKGVQ